MLWNKAEWDKELLEFFRALIAFRRSHIDFMRACGDVFIWIQREVCTAIS